MTPRASTIDLTYIGGPTVLIDVSGVRCLTDPTFDPAGTDYQTAVYTLKKIDGPALKSDAVGRIDVILLSHDHHFDNLDRAGRTLLSSAGVVLTTVAGAGRLGGNAVGLAPWQSHDVRSPDGSVMRVTATPARHGPADGDRGPVIGFVLAREVDRRPAVYVSGDTVWYDGVEEVSRRFNPAVVLLFAGAARVREVGSAHLTMTAVEMVAAARAFSGATIVPAHFEGWAHFSESRAAIETAFADGGLATRLRWLPPGQPTKLPA